jgi:hypothetical protein
MAGSMSLTPILTRGDRRDTEGASIWSRLIRWLTNIHKGRARCALQNECAGVVWSGRTRSPMTAARTT